MRQHSGTCANSTDHPQQALKVSSHSPESSGLRLLSSPSLLKQICLCSANWVILRLTPLPAGERKTSTVAALMGLLSLELQFSYLAVTFCNAFGVTFASLHPHQVTHLCFLTSALCCLVGVWGSILWLDGPSLSHLRLLWLPREGLLVGSVLWSRLCSPPLLLLGCGPPLSFVIAALRGRCLLPPCAACCQRPPQRGSSVPVCGQYLVERSAEEKVIGKRGGREEGVLFGVFQSPEFTLSET